ncbi:nitroreductase family protein [Marinifilum caeruleilacunae]|nr:nitroreductase family protein [Marinifilum caeruleilacunae]
MYDLKRRVYDKVYNKSDIEKVKRDLALAYHIVEKGLTMPEPRPGFGKAVVMILIDTVERYEKFQLPENDLEFTQSVSVLKEYLHYHEEINFSLDQDLLGRLISIEERYAKVEGQKQIRTSKADYFKDKNAPFDQFCQSRYSVRNYTEEEVPMHVLHDCINLAQRSPSFCNRQPNRVHIVKSPEKKKAILEIQNGNRGFGHLAETLIVVSSVVSTTKDMHERFENHLNGGLFSMTLLNALHYNKIGACSLNWSVSDDKDMKLREIIDIPHNEVVLMIIACGYLPDEFSIASSPRKTAEEITKMH